jgi:outer membrane receptor protein involved in Fe transport
VRYESLDYVYDNLMLDGKTNENGVACPGAGCRYSRPSDRSDDFTNSTVQLGWIHDLNPGTQVYANLATAFRAPQATELYRLQANQLVTDLGSEEVDSFELGYRAGREGLSYALSAYYMTKDNVIFQDSDRNNVSGGETLHRGIEVNTVADLSDSLRLTVAASYARHTYEANIAPIGTTIVLNGLEMDTAPKLVGNVQLDWQLNPTNSLNFEWVHMDRYYTDEENLHKYAGHDLLNLRYRYDSPSSWYFAARVLNVLDTDYAERADYSGLGGGDRYFVGEPVSVYFTVGSNF